MGTRGAALDPPHAQNPDPVPDRPPGMSHFNRRATLDENDHDCGSLIAEDTTRGGAAMSLFDGRETVLASSILAALLWVAPAAAL